MLASTLRGLGLLVVLLAVSGCADTWREFRLTMGIDSAAPGPSAAVTDAHERGKEYLKTGQFGLAVQSFRTALRESPDRIEALNALAVSYEGLGRTDLASAYFNRALSVEPRSAQTLNNLGYLYARQGRHDVALAFLEKARAADAGDRTIGANLTLVESLAHPAAETETAEADQAAGQGDDGLKAEQMRIERTSKWVQSLVIPAAYRPSGADEPARGQGLRDGVELERVALAAQESEGGQAAFPARLADLRIEVSNGAGRLDMAARMRAYLSSRGAEAGRLTNDASFSNQVSVIFYRPGFRGEAEALAALLPLRVAVEPKERQRADVRLRLGGDLLDFDRDLISRFGDTPA